VVVSIVLIKLILKNCRKVEAIAYSLILGALLLVPLSLLREKTTTNAESDGSD